MIPSISPGSWPLSFSACWTFLISSLPLAPAEWLVDDISEEEDMPEDEEDLPEEDVAPEEDMPVSLDCPVALLLCPLLLLRLLPVVPL